MSEWEEALRSGAKAGLTSYDRLIADDPDLWAASRELDIESSRVWAYLRCATHALERDLVVATSIVPGDTLSVYLHILPFLSKFELQALTALGIDKRLGNWAVTVVLADAAEGLVVATFNTTCDLWGGGRIDVECAGCRRPCVEVWSCGFRIGYWEVRHYAEDAITK